MKVVKLRPLAGCGSVRSPRALRHQSRGDLRASRPSHYSAKYTDGESGLVYYGARHYQGITGRWVSRDPIDEQGGLNLFRAFCNRAIQTVDPLGYQSTGGLPAPDSPPHFNPDDRIMVIRKCEVVILFGHGDPDQVWRWLLPKGWECSAGAAITCWPKSNSRDLPLNKDLWPEAAGNASGIGDYNNMIQWGDSDENPNNPGHSQPNNLLLAGPVFDQVYQNALARANSLCGEGCCSSIRVSFVWKPRGKGKPITNPTNAQTDYRGSIIIQDYIVNCATKIKNLVPR